MTNEELRKREIAYQNDRTIFVEVVLNEVITQAASWVDHLERYTGELYNDDRVRIVCQNGHSYSVSIEFDSKTQIISDVLKEVMRH